MHVLTLRMLIFDIYMKTLAQASSVCSSQFWKVFFSPTANAPRMFEGLDTRNMIRLGLFTIGCFLPIAFGTVYREFFLPLAFGSVDPSGRCPDGWTRFGSKCFVFIQDKQNWPEAQMTCDVLRGNLASISNAGENGVVSKMLSAATADKAWIGLHDLVTEGHFVWTKTNRAANYTNWKRGEPNNLNGKQHCGAVRRDQEWSDRPCSDRLPFVCETTDSHGR